MSLGFPVRTWYDLSKFPTELTPPSVARTVLYASPVRNARGPTRAVRPMDATATVFETFSTSLTAKNSSDLRVATSYPRRSMLSSWPLLVTSASRYLKSTTFSASGLTTNSNCP